MEDGLLTRLDVFHLGPGVTMFLIVMIGLHMFAFFFWLASFILEGKRSQAQADKKKNL